MLSIVGDNIYKTFLWFLITYKWNYLSYHKKIYSIFLFFIDVKLLVKNFIFMKIIVDFILI